jgi:REP element-mobilizing transposase RayT
MNPGVVKLIPARPKASDTSNGSIWCAAAAFGGDVSRVGRQKNFTGEHFCAREYFVSTVGSDENIVRAYIRNQEEEDEWYDQIKLVRG